MENQDLTPVHHTDTSRPSLGFPLGTALLLIIIFGLSGFFSCCYHWEKLRSLRRSFSSQEPDPDNLDPDSIPSPTKPTSPYPNLKEKQIQSLPVIMAGDNIPKFMALPCPCEPPRPEKITIEVQTPPMQPVQQSRPSPPLPQIVYNHVARFGVYYDG
ncbi:hypothetical protein AQUCO_01000032v1 [Aquilegia coerulea]|uniref:Hydroxyproline-rich glycoprotein family protein n=1 Tax=Aquilegia coerulea TaxID=218851 RepID=A0A2G5E7W6_AQUCA|nr:hypothetical protein AQUCO_01000032v1 [Aquilegia coerulea]